MAYTPINWQTGDTITADKLNRCDNGWGVESTQLFSETVTTVVDPEYPDDPPYAQLAYTSQITADTIIVTFDGTDYSCDNQDGTYSSAGYPFRLMSILGFGNVLETDVAGTYEVSAATSSVDVSSSFQSAVNSCVDTNTMPMECVSGVTTLADMQRAYGSGRILFFRPYRGVSALKYITDFTNTSVNYIPEDTQIRVSIANGIFSVTNV